MSSRTDGIAKLADALRRLGFDENEAASDLSNKMFVLLELTKSARAPEADVVIDAKPCIYKRR